MRTEILGVEFLNKTFSQEKVLNNVSFNVFEGETLALLGANGAGKTSLINIISGITPMDSENCSSGEAGRNQVSARREDARDLYYP